MTSKKRQRNNDHPRPRLRPQTIRNPPLRRVGKQRRLRAARRRPAYTILLPPPNVTGTLHMGHAFQHTLQDALIRYHRMRGYGTLWQMGTDHAGIATEMVVARNLSREGLTRDDLGRDKFIEKVWKWKAESGDTIERQMRRLGTSGDWSRSVFTMDPMPSRRGDRSLRAAARGRPDLSRPAPGQLGPGAEDRDLRSGSRQRGRGWFPLVDLLSADRRQWLAAWSRRRGRRPCSATPRWRCIPTTSATRTWSARRSRCR